MSHTNSEPEWQLVKRNKTKSLLKFKTTPKKHDNRNHKKILCHNIITHGSCCYGQKCLYAHSLEDQNIDTNKKSIYDLIDSPDLSSIDLQKNHSLYRSLLNLTKMCELCAQNKCTGGYNCKFGACSKKYNICLKDLNYGTCHTSCPNIHLTNKGLQPFYNNTLKTPESQTHGTLLSPEFFKTSFPTISNTSSPTTPTIHFVLQNDDKDEFDESIFSPSTSTTMRTYT